MKEKNGGNSDVLFFATPADFRAWLAQHHAHERELWVGFYKKGSGRPSITWPESVEEALCVGWIDGIRKSIDGESYKIRFTPRKPTSNWSAVNVARVAELTREGRMRPPGLEAYARLAQNGASIYSDEHRKQAKLTPEQERKFRRAKTAWRFFEAQPPGYRKVAIWRVTNAKQAVTREKRLAHLIAESEAGRRT